MPSLPGMCLVAAFKPSAEELAVKPDVLVDGKPAVIAATTAPGGGRGAAADDRLDVAVEPAARLFGQVDTAYSRFWSRPCAGWPAATATTNAPTCPPTGPIIR